LSLWNLLSQKTTREVTSTDIMKLGNFTFVDTSAKADLKELKLLVDSVSFLQASGQSVLADSLKIGSQTANASSVNFKPSNIYDGEEFSSKYLIQVLAIGATATGGDTAAVGIGLTDGANLLQLLKTTSVTASGPLSFEPTSPLFINEDNYLVVSNSASVDSVITVYCGIVARGGA
jgi:hypothetical protein